MVNVMVLVQKPEPAKALQTTRAGIVHGVVNADEDPDEHKRCRRRPGGEPDVGRRQPDSSDNGRTEERVKSRMAAHRQRTAEARGAQGPRAMAQDGRILNRARVYVAIGSEVLAMVCAMVQFGRQAKQRESPASMHGVTMDEPFTNRGDQIGRASC